MLILKGHKGRLRSMAFSPDGALLASAAGKGTSVSLWDTVRGVRIGFLSGHSDRVTCLAFAPGPSGLLASAGLFGGVILWDAASRVSRLALPQPHGAATCLSFSPDGGILAGAATGFPGYSVSLWDAGAGDERGMLVGSRVNRREEPQTNAWSMAFSPDGRTLAVGGDRGTDLWCLEERSVRQTLRQTCLARAVAFSPDGRTLATTAQKKVLLWSLGEEKPRATLRGHGKVVNALAFSIDGRTLASAGCDGVVRLWDTTSGMERAAFDWQVGKVHAVAFAPDAMRAAAGGEADIVVWDLDDGV